MRSGAEPQKPTKTWLFWRAAWAAMLFGHAPATLSAIAGVFEESAWTRLLLLLASQTLFLLKLVDVCWLRVPLTARAAFALTAAAVLLHAGVLAPAGASPSESLEPWQSVAIVAVMAVISDLLPRAEQRVHRLRPRLVARRARDMLMTIHARAAQSLLPRRFLLLARSVSLHRAPPAAAA